MKTPAKLLRDAIEAARQKVAPPQPVPNHDIAVLRRDQSGKVIGLKTPDGDDVDVVLVEKNLTGGIELSGSGAALKAIAPPPNFSWPFAQYPVKAYWAGDVAKCSIAPESLIDPACFAGVLYYVDFTNGSDTNNGTSWATAVKSIWKAISLGNATGAAYRVKVKAGTYPRANSFTNNATVFPTQSVMLEAVGGRVVTGPFDSLTWAQDGTYTNTYSATRSNVQRVFDITATDEFGNYAELTPVASATLCNTTPGSWYSDGTKLYVRRLDGAAVTNTNTRAYLQAGCAVHKETGNHWYAKGFDLEGGTDQGVAYIYGNTGVPRRSVWVNCSAKYAGGAGNLLKNGFGALDFHGLVAFFGCIGNANTADGFNAHYTPGTGYCCLLTVGCTGFDNGRFTNQSNNGLTAHETVLAIDIGSEYGWNRGGTLRNIGTTQMWVVGSKIHDDQGDVSLGGAMTPTQVQVDNSAKLWMDSVVIYGGGTSLKAADTSAIYTRSVTEVGGSRSVAAGATIVAY